MLGATRHRDSDGGTGATLREQRRRRTGVRAGQTANEGGGNIARTDRRGWFRERGFLETGLALNERELSSHSTSSLSSVRFPMRNKISLITPVRARGVTIGAVSTFRRTCTRASVYLAPPFRPLSAHRPVPRARVPSSVRPTTMAIFWPFFWLGDD